MKSKKELANPKPVIVRKSLSDNYDEITLELKGEVLASIIVYVHGGGITNFVAKLEKALK